MPRRPEGLQTLLLTLELLRRIPRGRKVSARELHQQLPPELARDLRTVQRQLDALSHAFDIERDDSSKPYGYRWKERGAVLAIPNLSEQESLLLALAEEHLRHLLPASLMKSMAGFFNQAQRHLDRAPAVGRGKEWLGKVRVVSQTQPLLPPKLAPEVFDTVSQALYLNRMLHLDYRNASNRRWQIAVMPLGLAQQGPRLYLVCRYQGYDDERSLALHRILKAEMLPHEFKRPANFDLKRFDEDGQFGFGHGERIALRFRIEKYAGQHLRETPLSHDQTVVDRGGTLEVAATVVRSDQLVWWLRSFGKAVTAVKPAGLLD